MFLWGLVCVEVMKGLWAKKQAKLKRNSQAEKPVAAIKGSEMVDKEVHQVRFFFFFLLTPCFLKSTYIYIYMYIYTHIYVMKLYQISTVVS